MDENITKNITTSQLAKKLGVSENTILRHAKVLSIKGMRIGKSNTYTQEEVKAIAASFDHADHADKQSKAASLAEKKSPVSGEKKAPAVPTFNAKRVLQQLLVNQTLILKRLEAVEDKQTKVGAEKISMMTAQLILTSLDQSLKWNELASKKFVDDLTADLQRGLYAKIDDLNSTIVENQKRIVGWGKAITSNQSLIFKRITSRVDVISRNLVELLSRVKK